MVALHEWFHQAQGWRTDAPDEVLVAVGPSGQTRAILKLLPDGGTALIDRATGRHTVWQPEDSPQLGDLRHTMTQWYFGESLVLNPAIVPRHVGDALDILTDAEGIPEWIEIYDPERRWSESIIVGYLDALLRHVGLRVKSLHWETVNGAWVEVIFDGAVA